MNEIPLRDKLMDKIQYQLQSKYSNFHVDLNNEDSAWTKIYNLIGKNKKVLDLGCSSGNLAKVLHDNLNCEVTGLEINPDDAKKAEEFCKQTINCDLETEGWESKIEKRHYDTAVFADLLEHLKEPQELLSRVKPLLKENGQIIISVPNIAHASVRLELMLGSFEYEKLGILDDTHLKYFTFHSICRLIEEAGFYIEKVDCTTNYIKKSDLARHLAGYNKKLIDQFAELFSQPDALAYQYIIKANLQKPKQYQSYITQDFEKPNLYGLVKLVKDQEIYINNQAKGIKEIRKEMQKIKKSPSWKLASALHELRMKIPGFNKKKNEQHNVLTNYIQTKRSLEKDTDTPVDDMTSYQLSSISPKKHRLNVAVCAKQNVQVVTPNTQVLYGDDEITKRVTEFREMRDRVASLEQQVARKNMEMFYIYSSLSWRIMRVFQLMKKIIRKTQVIQLLSRVRHFLIIIKQKLYYPSRQEIVAQSKKRTSKKSLNNQQLVSIIITTHNGKYLQRCLHFLNENTVYSKYEVLIVDNGSDKDFLDFIKHEKIRVILNENNESFSVANNKGARNARGTYLVFLNDDTEPLYGWLSEMMGVVQKNKKVGAVGSKLVYPEKKRYIPNVLQSDQPLPAGSVQHAGIGFTMVQGMVKAFNKGIFQRPFDDTIMEERAVPAVTAACLLVSKEAFEAVGGFTEEYLFGYEDVDLCLKLLEIGKNNYYCPTSTLFHYEFGTQATERDRQKIDQRRIKNLNIFNNKWGSSVCKQLLLERIDSKQYWSNKKLSIGFVVTEDTGKSGAGDYYTARGMADALQELGYNTYLIPKKKLSEGYNIVRSIDVLVVMLHDFDPSSLVLDQRILTIAWIRNWTPEWINKSWFVHYNFVLCSSEKAREYLKKVKGIDSKILRIGVDTKLFSPRTVREKFVCDLVFTGNNWGVPRETLEMLPRGSSFSLKIFGKHWSRDKTYKKYWNGFIRYSELANVYSSARIVLDDHVSTAHTKEFGTLNSRIFEAMACGSCVITNAETADEQLPGAILSYRTREELQGLIKQYLHDDHARREIGERARALVLREHTYTIRAQQFIENLKEYITTNNEIFN